jgi:hypothetical protein
MFCQTIGDHCSDIFCSLTAAFGNGILKTTLFAKILTSEPEAVYFTLKATK